MSSLTVDTSWSQDELDFNFHCHGDDDSDRRDRAPRRPSSMVVGNRNIQDQRPPLQLAYPNLGFDDFADAIVDYQHLSSIEMPSVVFASWGYYAGSPTSSASSVPPSDSVQSGGSVQRRPPSLSTRLSLVDEEEPPRFQAATATATGLSASTIASADHGAEQAAVAVAAAAVVPKKRRGRMPKPKPVPVQVPPLPFDPKQQQQQQQQHYYRHHQPSTTTTTMTMPRSQDEIKENALVRNRKAAAKCRTKRSAAVTELAEQEHDFEKRNAELRSDFDELRAEVLGLKTELQTHAHCNCELIQQYLGSEARRFVENEVQKGRVVSAADSDEAELELEVGPESEEVFECEASWPGVWATGGGNR